MKKLILFLVCFALLSGTVLAVPPITIAVVENPACMDLAPFASRVQGFASDPAAPEEEQHHGVAVSSVLVGEGSRLPQDMSITLFPEIKHLSGFLETQPTENLVILNWSGGMGLGLKENWAEEIESITESFQHVIHLGGEEFQKEAPLLRDSYTAILEQLSACPNGSFSDLMGYAKRNLEIGMEQGAVTREQKFVWKQALTAKINAFSLQIQSRTREKFVAVKDILREAFYQHPNTLLMLALGNEGENIDAESAWQEVLQEESILPHTLLIYGTLGEKSMRRHPHSNFTEIHSAHTLGRPFACRVWDSIEKRYVREMGTSFSAPLATTDAFLEGQKIFQETGRAPLYSEVKAVLLSAGPLL